MVEGGIDYGYVWSGDYMNNYKYKWKYKDSERPYGKCYDCRIPYDNFNDMIIPDELWSLINPTYHIGAGLLCPTCIARRLDYIGKWYKNDLFELKNN